VDRILAVLLDADRALEASAGLVSFEAMEKADLHLLETHTFMTAPGKAS
jgi:hypothetical protein